MPPLIDRTPIQPIERPVLSQTQPMSLSRTPPAVSLYLENNYHEFVLATDIDWSGINLQLDAQDDTATLILRALDASKLAGPGEIGARHLKHILDDLHPDKRVRIAMGQGADAPIFLFQGYPMSRTPSWSEKHQALTCTCLSEGQELLRSSEKTQIVGRKMRYSSVPVGESEEIQPADVESDPPVFNAKGKPNRIRREEFLMVDDGSPHVLLAFTTDDAPKAELWSAANTLRYAASAIGPGRSGGECAGLPGRGEGVSGHAAATASLVAASQCRQCRHHAARRPAGLLGGGLRI